MTRVRFRLATYNVHKCRGLDRRMKPERIAAVISELNADVVAIQEILNVKHGRQELDQVDGILQRLPGYVSCFGENRTLYGGEYGNLTLSRFRFETCRNYDVTWRNKERRGCLRTDIHVCDKALMHIFNVHLGTGFVERRHQAQRLLSEEVLNRKEFSGPRIVVGDFNEWTRGLASKLMGGHFESVDLRAFHRYSRTYPGLLPLLHLDHFYFDKQLRLKSFRVHRSRKAIVASDHLPLIADFELQP